MPKMEFQNNCHHMIRLLVNNTSVSKQTHKEQPDYGISIEIYCPVHSTAR